MADAIGPPCLPARFWPYSKLSSNLAFKLKLKFSAQIKFKTPGNYRVCAVEGTKIDGATTSGLKLAGAPF